MRGPVVFALAGIVTILVFVTIQHLCSRTSARTRQSSGYAQAVMDLDSEIAAASHRAHGKSWLAFERLAQACMERGSLTGDLNDYARAERAVEQAFSHAPDGAGPFLTRARLNFFLHRFDRIEADLQAAERRLLLDARTRAAILGLRADTALQCGQYEQALSGFRAALSVHSSIEGLNRLAQYHVQVGAFGTAHRILELAHAEQRGASPVSVAWLHLQRGLIDLAQNRDSQAWEHYRDAAAALPGWWLVDEHTAEIHARRGAHDLARRMYRDLVARTDNPEFMVALAELVSGDERAELLERARGRYAEQMRLWPEATLGHALTFLLRSGSRGDDVVALAERNHRLRPGGASGVLLARAYGQAGRYDEARQLVQEILATPYRSADLQDLVAMTAAKAGLPLSFGARDAVSR